MTTDTKPEDAVEVLLPCPFCKGYAVVLGPREDTSCYDRFIVECQSCGVFNGAEDRTTAITRWNTRLATSTTPTPVAEVAKLVSQIGEYIGLTRDAPRATEADQEKASQAAKALGAMAVRAAPAPVAMQEGEVERVARGLCEAEGDDPDREGSWQDWWRESAYARNARAAIAALRASSPVGEG